MKLSKSANTLEELARFRNLMGGTLRRSDIEPFFSTQLLDQIGDTSQSEVVLKKIELAQKEVNSLQLFRLVKFVAVTGSVAAGTAKTKDDIDLFIVVKNHTSWIYRGLLMVKKFKSVLHVGDRDKKDKLCVNFIVEERALSFEERDLFILHELIYMKPALNPEYKTYILNQNMWIHKDYGVLIPEIKIDAHVNRNYLFIPVNFISMLAQVGYMIVTFHSPSLKRIWRNYKKGRIAFYPEGFKEKSLQAFNSMV